ncbi:hypothetical protein F0726_02245 [Acidithiobacillus caldus]|nr:hypothetical protein F0726_02245 [Acidithiobacillus caldus]
MRTYLRGSAFSLYLERDRDHGATIYLFCYFFLMHNALHRLDGYVVSFL